MDESLDEQIRKYHLEQQESNTDLEYEINEYNRHKYYKDDDDTDDNKETEEIFIEEDSTTFDSPFKLIRPIRVFAIDNNGIAHPKIVAQRTFCPTVYRDEVYYSKYCKKRKQWLRWIGDEDEEFNQINNITDEPSPKRCKRDAVGPASSERGACYNPHAL